MSEKTAVILFNLGGPDSREAIRPFLMNFFMDPNIIRLPWIFRFPLAWLISQRRSRNEARASYGELGGKSPLLENTEAQARALEDLLARQGEFRVFTCMRYWHPMADEVVRAVKDWNPARVVLLPLYPQFSTTTTRSFLQVWVKAAQRAGIKAPARMVCCYPAESGFIQACAESIRKSWNEAVRDGHAFPRILFSAHGLPESVIKDGDPYQWQCELTARAIADALGIPNLDWTICYQSRVGPKKWIGPSTEDEIRRAAREGKAIIIHPHAFTQEHVETLVELDIEYRHLAEGLGIPGYYRAPTPGISPDFIAGLARMVMEASEKIAGEPLESLTTCANTGSRVCPSGFRRCGMACA